MEKNKQKSKPAPGAGLTLETAKKYAENDLKVSIGFLEFILRDPDVINMVAQKMLLLQEQLKSTQPKTPAE